MSEGTGGELAQIFHDMGQHCEIKRVDKNKKVIGEAKPEEFEQEVNRAQRMGTVAGGLKGLSRAEKMQWALDVKDQANEFYRERRFKEAATAYQDCLLGLDFGSNEEQANESKMKLQLPIVLNLAACFLEQGAYFQAAEVSKLATEVDPTHPKGWFRRGLAHWRLENAYEAKPHFEQAVKLIESQAATPDAEGFENVDTEQLSSMLTRAKMYLARIRAIYQHEKAQSKRILSVSHYDDKPEVEIREEKQEVADDDEALMKLMRQSTHQGDERTRKTVMQILGVVSLIFGLAIGYVLHNLIKRI